MWSVPVTIIAMKMNQRVICIVELNTVVMETQQCASSVSYTYICCCQKYKYRGSDKPIARPGRKQATGIEGFEFRISYL